LFSFIKKKEIILAEGMAQSPLHSLFHLPLSQQAHGQMLQLQNILEGVSLNESTDRLVYIWSTGQFSVKRAYNHLSGHRMLHPVYNWLWRSSFQNKHKVFFWLLINDRLSTRELLRRKNMDLLDYNCILCNGSTEESLLHLFLGCPFATQCWAWLNIQVDHDSDPFQNLQGFKEQLGVPFFMEVIILMCWTIWKARNDKIFRQIYENLQISKQNFRDELQFLLLRTKRSYHPGIDQWIADLT